MSSVLVEDVRHLAVEQNNIVADATEYATSSTSMALLRDYGNVTLSVAGFLMFMFDVKGNATGGWWKLKVGGLEVFGYSTNSTSYVVQVGKGAFIYLPAGTYDIQLWAGSGSTGTVYAKNFYAGFFQMSDQDNSIQPTTYATQLSLTVAARTTCVGPLKQTAVKVQVFARTPSGQTNLENVGDTLTNGVALTVNGSQVSWDNRLQDTNPEQCCFGDYSYVGAVGSAQTFAISLRNANTVVVINVRACPWLLPSSSQTTYEPVTLSFSQQSTVYINLAPLTVDETKTLNLGKKRALSFGSATDYFSTSSGTGLVSWNYTFSLVQLGDVQLFAYGTTNGSTCIEMIGVDAR